MLSCRVSSKLRECTERKTFLCDVVGSSAVVGKDKAGRTGVGCCWLLSRLYFLIRLDIPLPRLFSQDLLSFEAQIMISTEVDLTLGER